MDSNAIANAYLATWNEPDQEQRKTLLDKHWATQAEYIDPVASAANSAELQKLIEAVQTQFPGHKFVLRGVPDGHGVHARLSWTLSIPGGTPVAHGSDTITLNGSGKIRSVIGFFDQV